MRNPIKEQQIDTRIDQLFPKENFYFYKIFKESNQTCVERNELEKKQLLKFITDCMQSKRYYIVKGLIEPVHLNESERDHLVEGMLESVKAIYQEVSKSAQIHIQTFGKISEELKCRTEETYEFYKKFIYLLNEKPYTLQKCSLHGIVLAKEILSKTREEVNQQC